jgi:hypothetical protein
MFRRQVAVKIQHWTRCFGRLSCMEPGADSWPVVFDWGLLAGYSWACGAASMISQQPQAGLTVGPWVNWGPGLSWFDVTYDALRWGGDRRPAPSPLEQEVALGHGEHVGGLAGEQFPIGADFVGFGVHLHVGLVGVELHVGFAEAADGVDRFGGLLQADLGGDARFDGRLGHKADTGGGDRAPVAAEHRSHVDGLRGRDARVGVTHLRPGDRAPLQSQSRA